MVKLDKTPLEPLGYKITKPQDYRDNPIFSILQSDCNNKCYICEQESFTDLQVEHRVSRKFNPALELEWSNLFLSCTHCNQAKSNNFNEIIDCTVDDPEEFLAISIQSFPREYVNVAVLRDTYEARETANLLKLVHNGKSPAIRCARCHNLRKNIIEKLNFLRDKLSEYENMQNPLKQEYHQSIVKMIDRAAPFAAIMRTEIRNTPSYMKDFEQYLC
jgi:hypothetical protein